MVRAKFGHRRVGLLKCIEHCEKRIGTVGHEAIAKIMEFL